MRLDGGVFTAPSRFQLALDGWWDEFWCDWVPTVTRHEPYAVVVNGDALDGAHHGSKTQITQNFADQHKIAEAVLRPIVDLCKGNLWLVRGTEAHVGQCAENEEVLAKTIGAIQDEIGNYSHRDLWLRIGHGLAHFAHHIGTTSRAAYETSALMGELMEMYVEAAKWRDEPPDVVVRSHRHRHIKVEVPTANTYGIVFTTPCWQGPTPYTGKFAGGRINRPQFGGALIRCGDEELYTRHFTRALGRPKPYGEPK